MRPDKGSNFLQNISENFTFKQKFSIFSNFNENFAIFEKICPETDEFINKHRQQINRTCKNLASLRNFHKLCEIFLIFRRRCQLFEGLAVCWRVFLFRLFTFSIWGEFFRVGGTQGASGEFHSPYPRVKVWCEPLTI